MTILKTSMFNITYPNTTTNVEWEQLTADMQADDFDNGRTPHELRRSFENSAGVVFARQGGRIISEARALSESVCNAYVVDLWNHSDYRRRGDGEGYRPLVETAVGI